MGKQLQRTVHDAQRVRQGSPCHKLPLPRTQGVAHRAMLRCTSLRCATLRCAALCCPPGVVVALHLAHAGAERDVLLHSHVAEQRVALQEREGLCVCVMGWERASVLLWGLLSGVWCLGCACVCLCCAPGVFDGDGGRR